MIGSLNRVQVDNLLRSEMVGRIGCSAEGVTYVVPVTYVYDGTAIYGHTKGGMKTEIIEKNSSVCFEVDHVDNLANWQSAIVQGEFEELKGKEAEVAMQMLVNRVHPYVASETAVPRHGLDRPHSAIDPNIRMVVFKISVSDVSGRYEKS